MPEQDDYHALCMAVGFVVVNWAIAEHSLDGWVAITYHDHGGKDLAKRIPKALSAKVEFLTECFQKAESLAAYKDEALSILARVTDLSEKRHDLVHGAITSVSADNGVFFLTRLDFERHAISVRQVDFDLRKFR